MHKLELNTTTNLFSTKRSCLLETRHVTSYIPTPCFSRVSYIFTALLFTLNALIYE